MMLLKSTDKKMRMRSFVAWPLSIGALLLAGGPPERFEAMIKSEMARMGKVIKDAGITAD